MASRVSKVYLLNVSSWFCSFAARIQRFVLTARLNKKITAATVDELQDFSSDLSAWPQPLRQADALETFTNIMRKHGLKRSVAVSVALLPSAVVVTALDKVKIFGVAVAPTDVIMIADMAQVATATSHGQQVFFFIKKKTKILSLSCS